MGLNYFFYSIKKEHFLHFIVLVTTLIFIPEMVNSQTRGEKSSFSKDLLFEKKLLNFNLDQSPTIGSSSRVQFSQTISNTNNSDIGNGVIKDILGASGIDIPDWLSNLTGGASFFCSDITPVFNASASINVGGYYQTKSVGTSNVEVIYPVKVFVEFPKENTFACGDLIKITTSYSILEPTNKNKLKVTPPFITQEIGAVLNNLSFDAEFGLDAEVGFGVSVAGVEICSNKLYFDKKKSFSFKPTIPNLPPLVTVCEQAFGTGANESSLLSCSSPTEAKPLLKLGQFILDDYNSRHNTKYTFATFPNINTVVIAPPDFATSLDAPTIPELEGVFKNTQSYPLTFSSDNEVKKLVYSGSQNAVSKMSIDLISFLDYSKISTSYSLGSGAGSVDLGDVAPVFTMNQHMNFEFSPTINLTIDLGESMKYEVFNNEDISVRNGTGRLVDIVAGQYIMAQFPQNCSTPINASGSSYLNGNFKSKITQDYYKSIQLKFGEIKLKDVIDLTILNKTIGNSKFGSKSIVDSSLMLETNHFSLPSFVLDPEDPIITIDDVTIEDMRNLGNGEKAIVYKVQVSNGGDVKLNDVRLELDLEKTFKTAKAYSVSCLFSNAFSTNLNFNGNAEKNLLGNGNSLEIGESKYVEILVKVKPEIAKAGSGGCFDSVDYSTSSKAFAISPIGTAIENNYNQCTKTTTGNDIIATAGMGASVINDINDYTIYGWDLVKFDKPHKTSMGNIGSSGDVIFENTSKQNSAPTIIIGDIQVGKQLFIQGESKIEADYILIYETIKMPNKKGEFTLNGTYIENSNCVATQPIITLNSPKVTGKNKVIISKNTLKVIPPGNYREIVFFEGSEAVFTSGIYNIGRLAVLGNNTKIQYNILSQKVRLNIDTWQINGKNIQMNLTNGNVNNVIYNYSGKQPISFNASNVKGRIFAPNAKVEFSESTSMEGTCYAKTVNFKTGSYFIGAKFLKELIVNPNCQDVLTPNNGIYAKSNLNSFSSLVKEEILSKQLFTVNVYPNPTKDIITIEGMPNNLEVIIKVFNSIGQLILQQKNNSTVESISLESLPSGLYYIHIEGTDSTIIIKE